MRVELPSGDIKEFEGQANMFEIAKSISNSLAKKAVAVKIDGVPMDMATILDRDAKVEFIPADSEEGDRKSVV